MGGESLLTESEDDYRSRVKRELVAKYSTDGANNVTYVDFARIHNELRAALVVWRMQNGAS